MRKIFIEVEVRPMSDEALQGDYVEFRDKIWQFIMYDYDTIWLKDIETGEERQYDWY